jgi:hypothetical protein
MPPISLVNTFTVVGVLLWLVTSYIPMDGKIKRFFNAFVVTWLLHACGILNPGGNIHVPQVR